MGPEAGPGAIATIASAAERLGFDSLSVSERLLLPGGPGWQNEYGLPEYDTFDAIESLTWVAALTTRVRLLTGVINSLFQPPVVLARRLATLDSLSGGRLDVGIGQGWMPEEFAAVGVPLSRRGAGFEEHLAAMRACWGPNPVQHDGPRYPIASASIGPKPIKGQIPVFIGALAPAAIERAARIGDGFITALRDWDTTIEEMRAYRAAGGSGPVVLRGNPAEFDPADSPQRLAEALAEHSRRALDAGADEVHWDLGLAGLGIARQVEVMERFASIRE